MEKNKLYGTDTEELRKKYGCDGITSLTEWDDLVEKDSKELLEVLYPNYETMNDKKKSKIINDNFNYNIAYRGTDVKWIISQMKDPKNPLYQGSIKETKIIRVASQYLTLCDEIPTSFLAPTGKEKLTGLHDSWGGVIMPEYEDELVSMDFSENQFRYEVEKAVKEYNKKLYGRKNPISVDSAIEIKKYLLYRSDFRNKLAHKEQSNLNIKKALQDALTGVSIDDMQNAERAINSPNNTKETKEI